MNTCIGTTGNGQQCSYQSRVSFEGNYCRIHFNKKQREDPAFKSRYEAHLVAEAQAVEERRQNALVNAANRQAQDAANAAARAQRIREQKIRKNQKAIEDAPLQNPHEITLTARSLMSMWDATILPGLEIPKAYVFLKFRTSSHVGFPDLIRSVVRMIRQGLGNHPTHARYVDVPMEERGPALETLRHALTQYGEITNRGIIDMIPIGDPFRPFIRNHIITIDVRAAQEAARLAAQAQLQQDLLHNPVVFQRDPEGSINLQAFAQDQQSVHRSSVQNATHRSALALLERPVPTDQDTLPEIVEAFNRPNFITWRSDRARERVITEVTNDYFNTEAFSLRYSDVLDRVWAYIKAHTEKGELSIRLAQEIAEGYRMCTNGKMARLINVLQGYDETLETAAPKELFQIRIAQLMERPVGERESAANELFTEFHIAADERQHWLEPLLEA